MDTWTELAARCHISRNYAKETAYLLVYGGKVDPWLDYIISTELAAIKNAAAFAEIERPILRTMEELKASAPLDGGGHVRN